MISVRDLLKKGESTNNLISPEQRTRTRNANLNASMDCSNLLKTSHEYTRPQTARFEPWQIEYKVPQYSWRKPRMYNSAEKKLDYVSVFAEESKPFLNLTKIYVNRKKHSNPPPNAYNLANDWKKEQQKNSRGRWLKSARVTPAVETANIAKKEKFPGPATYKPNSKSRVLGAFNLTTEQMQMFGNQKFYSMQTPSSGKYDPEAWVSSNLNNVTPARNQRDQNLWSS